MKLHRMTFLACRLMSRWPFTQRINDDAGDLCCGRLFPFSRNTSCTKWRMCLFLLSKVRECYAVVDKVAIAIAGLAHLGLVSPTDKLNGQRHSLALWKIHWPCLCCVWIWKMVIPFVLENERCAQCLSFVSSAPHFQSRRYSPEMQLKIGCRGNWKWMNDRQGEWRNVENVIRLSDSNSILCSVPDIDLKWLR